MNSSKELNCFGFILFLLLAKQRLLGIKSINKQQSVISELILSPKFLDRPQSPFYNLVLKYRSRLPKPCSRLNPLKIKKSFRGELNS